MRLRRTFVAIVAAAPVLLSACHGPSTQQILGIAEQCTMTSLVDGTVTDLGVVRATFVLNLPTWGEPGSTIAITQPQLEFQTPFPRGLIHLPPDP